MGYDTKLKVLPLVLNTKKKKLTLCIPQRLCRMYECRLIFSLSQCVEKMKFCICRAEKKEKNDDRSETRTSTCPIDPTVARCWSSIHTRLTKTTAAALQTGTTTTFQLVLFLSCI